MPNYLQTDNKEPLCSVFKLLTESVGSRRELVANCVHTADADATELDSCVASAVCTGLKIQRMRSFAHHGNETIKFHYRNTEAHGEF